MSDTFLAHRGLMVFASVSAIAEAAVTAAFAPASIGLAAQVSALAPLAVFHDLRWLYSTPRPWEAFLALLAAVIAVRAAITATLVRLSWPRGISPQSAKAAMTAAAGFTAFACIALSPIVSLTFGVAILPFSWPYLAALPAMLGIAATLSCGGVTPAWWRLLPPPSAAGWLLADFAALSAGAAFAQHLPVAAQIAVTGAVGLVNARAWYGVTRAALRTRPIEEVGARRWPRRVPATLIATAGVILIAIAATRVVFWATSPARGGREGHIGAPAATVAAAGQWPPGPWTGQQADPTPDRQPEPAPGQRQSGPTASRAGLATPATARRSANGPAEAARHGGGGRLAVLVVLGFGSHCCGRVHSIAQAIPGARVRQFSYRGLDEAGDPLPYGPAASNLPLPLLGDRIAAQVERLHAATGRQVDVVAESEGTLGVDAMLARHRRLPVGAIALLSPIIAPGQSGFETAGPDGAVPRAQLDAVVWFIGGLSPFGTSGAQVLIDSVNRDGTLYARQAASRRTGRVLEVVPLADAVTLPACPLPADVRVLPALHGMLLSDPAALRMVREFLNGRPVLQSSGLRTAAEALAGAASAWRMPQANPPSPPCGR